MIVAFSFMRMNPPTLGHKIVLDKLKATGLPYQVYLSRTQDKKKNPLPFDEKYSFITNMFPEHAVNFVSYDLKDAFQVCSNFYKMGVTSVIMVVGEDRADEFQTRLRLYNDVEGKHGYYKFDSIEVISAGERDLDSDDVSGISSSKMREYVKQDDFDSFCKGTPVTFKHNQELFDTLKTYLV